MSSFKLFAVLGGLGGSGPMSLGIGKSITKALLSQGAKVRVVAREGSSDKGSRAELEAAGATFAVVDYEKPNTLKAAFQGVDVVVSTLSSAGLASQIGAIEAAKASGVKLFVPSEFGSPRDRVGSDSPFFPKQNAADKAKEIGLPTLLLWTAAFAEIAKVVFGPKDGKIVIYGDGKQKISFTAIPNIADYLAYILTSVHPREYEDKTLRIHGSSRTYEELLPAMTKEQPDVQVEYRDVAEAKKAWTDNHDFFAFIKAGCAEGGADLGADLANGLAGNHVQWKPVEAFL